MTDDTKVMVIVAATVLTSAAIGYTLGRVTGKAWGAQMTKKFIKTVNEAAAK